MAPNPHSDIKDMLDYIKNCDEIFNINTDKYIKDTIYYDLDLKEADITNNDNNALTLIDSELDPIENLLLLYFDDILIPEVILSYNDINNKHVEIKHKNREIKKLKSKIRKLKGELKYNYIYNTDMENYYNNELEEKDKIINELEYELELYINSENNTYNEYKQLNSDYNDRISDIYNLQNKLKNLTGLFNFIIDKLNINNPKYFLDSIDSMNLNRSSDNMRTYIVLKHNSKIVDYDNNNCIVSI
ncbi:hypothetical protein MYSEV_019 [Mythimna separata entomopoxvirus 'L']|uniref:Uncharacterized protein n=1 Tax=Mythimna separata entomopoxvirus 'L' TaxID=1293572 RepID=A0A916P1B0_9POXV|nr:hypothetical protein MYSEV_019 [Mythimna separata entomopoxvirus 'L']CCU56217.1 hypothetical protein MYSEV_019 [Mythimna separata entomopoxvirus 'L']